MITAYKFATLDPRTILAAREANEKIFASGPVFGIEVTDPALAAQCDGGNIDPQHGCHVETCDNGGQYMEGTCPSFKPGETAIEFAARQNPNLGLSGVMLPLPGSTLVTLRPDLDSVGGMAVISLIHQGVAIDSPEVVGRITMVATADKFAAGVWPGPRALPTKGNPWPQGGSAETCQPLAAIAAAVADFKVPLADRVHLMEEWLVTGKEPVQYRVQVEAERGNLITALNDGRIQATTKDGIALIESTHRAATLIGYCLAPVVIALNPEFRFQGGEPHPKFTVCQYETGIVDLGAVAKELAQLENGWGGSPTIIGSPQGVGSKLTLKQVHDVVWNHYVGNTKNWLD